MITIRRSRSQMLWKFIFPSNIAISGATAVTALDINYLYPLKISDGRININSTLKTMLDREYKYIASSPDLIMAYVYAILNSTTYRQRYTEFLRLDFPRIPLTRDEALYSRLSDLGARLIDLHLLKAQALEASGVSYPVPGVNEVEKGYPKFVLDSRFRGKDAAQTHLRGNDTAQQYPLEKDEILHFVQNDEQGRVYINPTQCFDSIPLEAWNFHIGGYQVLEKWLKDRRGRILTAADREHYRKVVKAIVETVRIMGEIDQTINKFGGFPSAF